MSTLGDAMDCSTSLPGPSLSPGVCSTHVHGVGDATHATESVKSHSKWLPMSYSDSDLVSIALTQTSLQPTSFSSSLASKTLTLFVLFLPIFLFQFNFSPNLVK